MDWSKVKELHASEKFAVVKKDVKLGKRPDAATIPQGAVAVSDQNLHVEPGAETIPISEVAHVVPEPVFERAVLNTPGLLHGWKGAITGAASLVEATQHGRTFTGNVTLARAIPTETWLAAHNRTLVNFSISHGTLDQPNSPRVKTDIYHLDAERDQYFSPRVYAFGQLGYDHNFSQGLDLEQNYGLGIGVTVVKSADTELDLKTSGSYIKQAFEEPTKDLNLFGSIFAETLTHKFRKRILLTQQISLLPTWSDLNAYSGSGNVTVTMPVYKRINFTAGAVDAFLNNPPPGFKKNSLQITTGLTYVLP